MNQSIRSVAVSFAVLFFFLIATIAWLKGLEPATCASRAFTAAVVIYIVVFAAGKILLSIIVNEMLKQKFNRPEHGAE